MRILIVLRNLQANRYEAAEMKMCMRELLSMGADIGAMYVTGHENHVDEHPQLHLLPLSWHDANNSSSIEARIREFKPDVAHIIACWTPFHARVSGILHKLGIPYLMEPCGHFDRTHLDHRFAERPCTMADRFKRRIYQRFFDLPMLKRAAVIRTVSDYEAEYLADRHSLKTQSIIYGFNTEWNTAVRLKRDTGNLPLRFLFVGRLALFQKGIDLILDAAALLNKAGYGSQYTVTLAGPPLEGSDQRIAKRLQEEDLTNVKVSPPVYDQEKHALFAEHDVFLHPSRFEGVAKMAREATAAGLPVIASRESNYGDWAVQNGFGISTVITGAGVAEAMLAFIKAPDLVVQMGRAGVEFAKRSDWPSIALKVFELYNQTLQSAGK